MSLAEVQNQVASLTPEERRKLAAFLTALRMKESGEWEQIARVGEHDPSGWISLEEAKRRLLEDI